jgi:hypothetical protein
MHNDDMDNIKNTWIDYLLNEIGRLPGYREGRVFMCRLYISCMVAGSNVRIELKSICFLRWGHKLETTNTDAGSCCRLATFLCRFAVGCYRHRFRCRLALTTSLHHVFLFAAAFLGCHCCCHLFHGHFLNKWHIGQEQHKNRYEQQETHVSSKVRILICICNMIVVSG